MSQELPSQVSPEEMKTYAHTKTCTWIFIGAVFIIVKWGGGTKSASTDAWINILYIYIMEYYLSIKRSEVLIYATHKDGPCKHTSRKLVKKDLILYIPFI